MSGTEYLGAAARHGFPSGKSICIIGGAGFIGRHLAADLCARACSVRIVDLVAPHWLSTSKPVTYSWGDVRDLDSLSRAVKGCDILVNLAAAHRDDVRPLRLYDEINVDGARNVCRAATINGIERILFTSSVAVYGDAPEDCDEAQPHRPTNDYGRTKSAAERVYTHWQSDRTSPRSLVIVRPTVVFGPGNRGNVHTLISQIASGRFAMVGDGKNRKSMAYVGNVSAFICHLLSAGHGVHVYNYVDKPDLSMNELVALVRSSLGMNSRVPVRLPYPLAMGLGYGCDLLSRAIHTNLPVSRTRVDKFCTTTVFSADKALTHARFTPVVALESALKQTIAAEFRLGALGINRAANRVASDRKAEHGGPGPALPL
jgi:nucleoside-diphosphate-sugar epimerase